MTRLFQAHANGRDDFLSRDMAVGDFVAQARTDDADFEKRIAKFRRDLLNMDLEFGRLRRRTISLILAGVEPPGRGLRSPSPSRASRSRTSPRKVHPEEPRTAEANEDRFVITRHHLTATRPEPGQLSHPRAVRRRREWPPCL
jgi:hypothetical protein